MQWQTNKKNYENSIKTCILTSLDNKHLCSHHFDSFLFNFIQTLQRGMKFSFKFFLCSLSRFHNCDYLWQNLESINYSAKFSIVYSAKLARTQIKYVMYMYMYIKCVFIQHTKWVRSISQWTLKFEHKNETNSTDESFLFNPFKRTMIQMFNVKYSILAFFPVIFICSFFFYTNV